MYFTHVKTTYEAIYQGSIITPSAPMGPHGASQRLGKKPRVTEGWTRHSNQGPSGPKSHNFPTLFPRLPLFCSLLPTYEILKHVRGIIREGNGTPLQYSCLDGGAWWTAVHGGR